MAGGVGSGPQKGTLPHDAVEGKGEVPFLSFLPDEDIRTENRKPESVSDFHLPIFPPGILFSINLLI